MPKEFYTEKDIEDLVKRGVMSLQVNDNVVLTDLAYERANRLGMRLVRDKPDNPPAAPVRPYLSEPGAKPGGGSAPGLATGGRSSQPQPGGGDLHNRIRQAVIARLGNQVDAKLLDVIITRVLNSTGVK